MKLEQSFEVSAPIEQVWTALIDLEKVAPCLPGAAITGHDDDGTYHGTFQVKLGPTTANYRGTVKIESADAETHTARLAARGQDKRGQGGATATIVNSLHEAEGGPRASMRVTDFTITGRLASFGRGGMIKDISNRLMRDFATCLQQRLAAEPAGEMTAEEAAASAGAADAVGKSPAEVSGTPRAEVSGKTPAELGEPLRRNRRRDRAAGEGLLAAALGRSGSGSGACSVAGADPALGLLGIGDRPRDPLDQLRREMRVLEQRRGHALLEGELRRVARVLVRLRR